MPVPEAVKTPDKTQFISHGSGYFIPNLLYQTNAAADILAEARHNYRMQRPNIEPLSLAYEIFYIKVWAFIRSEFPQENREVMNTIFRNVGDIMDEIKQIPEKRKIKSCDTYHLYKIAVNQLTSLHMTMHDYLQGEKDMWMRSGGNKDDLFKKSIEELEKQLKEGFS